VFVALITQHAMRMSRTVIWGLSGSTEIPHIILKTARFSGKKCHLLIFLFWQLKYSVVLDLCLTVHHQLGKVI